MNTIHDKWVEFQATVVPPNASPTQIREMRKSFYAGIYAYMRLQLANSEVSEEAGVALLQGWEGEVVQFALRAREEEAKQNG